MNLHEIGPAVPDEIIMALAWLDWLGYNTATFKLGPPAQMKFHTDRGWAKLYPEDVREWAEAAGRDKIKITAALLARIVP